MSFQRVIFVSFAILATAFSSVLYAESAAVSEKNADPSSELHAVAGSTANSEILPENQNLSTPAPTDQSVSPQQMAEV